MKTLEKNGKLFAVCDKNRKIYSIDDALDLIADSSYNTDCRGVIVYKECLQDAFFDLKTGIAGEILQKFSNYNYKLAIVGDFYNITSKSLRDFIYECNKGSLVFFKDDIESALEALASA